MKRYFIGVDLGLKGGIVIINEKGLIEYKCVLPILGERLDARKVAAIIQSFMKQGPCHVIFERFKGFFGYSKSSATSISRQLGTIEAVVSMLGTPSTQLIPQTWQKEMWTGTKIVMKKEKGKMKKDTKKTSLNAAKRLYPSESFLATKRSSVPHTGLVDAFLLGMYGWRKNL